MAVAVFTEVEPEMNLSRGLSTRSLVSIMEVLDQIVREHLDALLDTRVELREVERECVSVDKKKRERLTVVTSALQTTSPIRSVKSKAIAQETIQNTLEKALVIESTLNK
jgi:hypothetical protein